MTQLAHHQQLAALQPQIDERRRAEAMHHDRHIELSGQLLRAREMIRMGVGIDQVFDPQPIAGCQREITIDLTQLGIDQRRGAGFFATDADRSDSHRTPRFRTA